MKITPELLLKAYASGYFPMAETAGSAELYWVDPPLRGIIPLDGFHVGRSLRKVVRAQRFEVSLDRDFQQTIEACASPRHDRPDTWINAEIKALYTELHRLGHAHSVECWRDGAFAGGLYGVSLGGAFFGESMVSLETDASKVALVHLVAQLLSDGFDLLDTQFSTEHLAHFGCIEVPKSRYLTLLNKALSRPRPFGATDRRAALEALVSAAPKAR
ncbi:MAG: leucyl/phenylalanyl-tRNA--protein transferase [Azospirillaceae bacterium]